MMSQRMRNDRGEDDVVAVVVVIHDFAFSMEEGHEVLPGLGDAQGEAGDAVDHHVGEAVDEGLDAFAGSDGDKNGAGVEVAF